MEAQIKNLKNLDGFDEVVKFADYQPNDEDFDK
jgi:hypothetical protein